MLRVGLFCILRVDALLQIMAYLKDPLNIPCINRIQFRASFYEINNAVFLIFLHAEYFL